MKPEDRLAKARDKYAAAKTERDDAIRAAAAEGMTRRAIARIVGISFQRVHQIIHSQS